MWNYNFSLRYNGHHLVRFSSVFALAVPDFAEAFKVFMSVVHSHYWLDFYRGVRGVGGVGLRVCVVF